MYVGSNSADGLYHLMNELVDNAVDEHLAGKCDQIAVTIQDDGSCSVADDGRGLPVGRHPDLGRPACEVVLTTLHSGRKFGRFRHECGSFWANVGLFVGQGHCILGLLPVTAVMRSWGRRLARRLARAMLVSPSVRWKPNAVDPCQTGASSVSTQDTPTRA
jgi:hypothetical protein